MNLKKKFLSLVLATLLAVPVIIPTVAFADNNIDSTDENAVLMTTAVKVSEPSIIGLSGITVDVTTGEIIYGKNVDIKKYPASTTKLMTALILAEKMKQSDILSYTESAKSQPTFSINRDQHTLNVGQKFTADNAMKALLISSANDIAFMIADNIGGDKAGFTALMNEKVAQIQSKYPYLKNTHFSTPNGIDNNLTDNLTTAYDLSVIGREAFKNPWVADTLKTESTYVVTEDGIKIQAENRNRFIQKDDSFYDATNLGGKTGYTSKAGRCLVSMFNRNGRKIIGVVLQSAYDANDDQVFSDMKTIIDWSYSQKQVTYLKANSKVADITLTYKLFRFFGPEKTIEVPLITKDNVNYYANNINNKEIKTAVNKSDKTLNAWKLSTKKAVVTLVVSQREAIKNINLYTTVTTGSIIKANLLTYILSLIVFVILAAILFLLILITVKRTPRKRKKRKIYR